MDTDTMFTVSRISRFSTVAKATTKKGVGATPSSNSTVRSAPVKPTWYRAWAIVLGSHPAGSTTTILEWARLAVWTHHRLQLQRRPLLPGDGGFRRGGDLSESVT